MESSWRRSCSGGGQSDEQLIPSIVREKTAEKEKKYQPPLTCPDQVTDSSQIIRNSKFDLQINITDGFSSTVMSVYGFFFKLYTWIQKAAVSVTVKCRLVYYVGFDQSSRLTL